MQDRKLLDTDLVFTETDEVLIILPQHTLKRDTADHRKLLQVATCNKCQDWYGFISLISKRLISTAEKLKEVVSHDTVIDMYGIGCELRCPWNRKKISIGITAGYRDWETDRKSTRLNSSHSAKSRMPSSA